MPLRKLGAAYDGPLSPAFWSDDGKTIYVVDGVKATVQVLAVSVETGAVAPVTSVRGAVFADRDEKTGLLQVTYSDPASAPDLYAVKAPERLGDRSAWIQLTNANPQVAQFALGGAEEISWKSKDGKTVGGILVKPVGFRSGQRYPLIVQIHGGPAAAEVLDFRLGYEAQVYAGNGYAVLLPNYRGSTNYGERHRLDIVGDYFQKGYEDIMTGVDELIRQGIAAPDSMGVMGWSAGGHWSNWILTHTDRFKAISSGAGAMNWISMYAQSDVQRNRAEYFGRGKKPWEDFEAYWRVSPLRYINNAKTPTLIHVVDGDPRVPRPQSEELHMALKQRGVPTEFFVYPGSTHGIPDPRNQYLKAVAEYAWFEKWIRGKPWFTWKELLATVEEPKK
jgi:dipeptidyl aminopeptidase/acylaminoacyl peptidase